MISITIHHDWQQDPSTAEFVVLSPSEHSVETVSASLQEDCCGTLLSFFRQECWWESLPALAVDSSVLNVGYSFRRGCEQCLESLFITVRAVWTMVAERLLTAAKQSVRLFSTFIVITKSLIFQRNVRMRL